ncbi:TonB-dependent receptor [Colwellia sp. 75C3]|uniref:TonB-dependent receptor n=1 Tax=Colwellia sp. 75C3 TaxID=888425 RepID=UPI000C32E85F|nr:TonB-dependent receptor [Colwellia sp. 75C3]PKG80687.1 TonB-dependent receptor [Colwellia sp. 75C3]
MKNKAIKSIFTLSACAFAINAAIAQEQATLEVIQVTAQKRSENAQETPISMNVLSAEDLKEKSIEKIDDLQYSVPNLHMTETGISTQMFIRGIGTGNNQGFEQSVGQYIDGVHYGRQQLLRMPFLDLERIEVLKGPQSIMFGKNSVAGALNLSSAKPTQDTEIHLGVQYQPTNGATEFTGMVTGALTETLSARLAVRDYSEDGYIENTFKNRDETIREESAVRLSLLWEPSDTMNFLFKIEQDDFDGTGRQIEVIKDEPALAGSPMPGATFSQILGALGHPNAISDSVLNYERQADAEESNSNSLNNATLTANFKFGDYTLTTVSGLVSYDFVETCDCDYTAAPIFSVFIDEEYEQFSQEIRLVSPVGEKFDWLGGLFYQTSELAFDDNIIIPTNSILGLGKPMLLPIHGQAAGRNYQLDTDMYSAFFQGRYHFTDALTLTLGARYTSEDKTSSRVMNITDISTGDITTNPYAPAIFDLAFGIQSEQSPYSPEGHNLQGERNETSFTPLINVSYKLDQDIMVYASATTGFKAGGFDARANNVNSWEFEEEEATAYELGIKSLLLDDTLEVNLSFYRTEYDNLQVSQFDGILGFNVGNAKETVVQGVEVDGRWIILDGLSMQYGMAYLDHEYKDFTNGNCHSRQVPDGDMGADGNQLCDYTGKSGQYTPKFTASIGFDYFTDISFLGFEYFRTTLGLYHSAKQNVDVNLNPLYEEDAYNKVDMRIALESENWNIALFGKNMTNEEVLTYVGNNPLSGSTFGTDTFYGFVDRPATYGIQVDYNF